MAEKKVKRMFAPKKHPSNVTKSIRITEQMANALQQLADDRGMKLNSYIVFRLDQMLQIEVKKGNIKPPSYKEEVERVS